MKKCKYCQSEIDSKAKICPQCQKKQSNPIVTAIRLFIGIIITFIGIGMLVSDIGSTEPKEEKCYITLEEFNKIQNGMTYDQVKEIVGCEGTINSESEVMGSKMTIYSWYGKDGISNANVNIQDNKLINKTQIGLE